MPSLSWHLPLFPEIRMDLTCCPFKSHWSPDCSLGIMPGYWVNSARSCTELFNGWLSWSCFFCFWSLWVIQFQTGCHFNSINKYPTSSLSCIYSSGLLLQNQTIFTSITFSSFCPFHKWHIRPLFLSFLLFHSLIHIFKNLLTFQMPWLSADEPMNIDFLHLSWHWSVEVATIPYPAITVNS